MMAIRTILAIAAGAAILTGCSRKEQTAKQRDVIARVGDTAITAADLREEAARRLAAGRMAPDRESLLRDMVNFEALVQRARKTGLADLPETRREIGMMLIGKLKEKELARRLQTIEISAEEVRAEYEKRIEQYTRPAQVRLAALFLEAGKTISAAKRKELTDRLAEARRLALANPAPGGRGPAAGGFAELAMEYSDDQATRYRGGDIGWLAEGGKSSRWPAQVLEAGYALNKGEVSGIIEAQGGFYIVKKSDEREAFTTPFEQVEPALRQSLLLKKRRELDEAFVEQTVDEAAVEMDLEALARVSLPESGAEAVSEKEPALPVPRGM